MGGDAPGRLSRIAGCAVCRPYGTRFYFPLDPGLPPWAKLFRPARRDWRIGQEDAEQIDKLRANKIPTLAKEG